jgi:hypothetical protein
VKNTHRKSRTARSLVAAIASKRAASTQAKADTPALTISNPSGYGASNNTIYGQFSYQSRTRNTSASDGEATVGISIGDSDNVAADISYTVNSFGANNNGDKLGDGGLNLKLHRRLNDSSSVAIGYNQLLQNGTSDYQKGTYFASYTKILDSTPKIAITAGIGGGAFNRFDSSADPNKANFSPSPFGSVAVRVAPQASAIAEWTGGDLAIGVSIVPFKAFPLTVNPAIRDLAGSNQPARFVLGLGTGFKF